MEPTRSKGGQRSFGCRVGGVMTMAETSFIQELNTAVLSASGYLLVDAWLLP